MMDKAKKQRTLLLVNFGGPRHLGEIYPFLQELLTDEDVIRTWMPKRVQDILFTRIAKKRAEAIKHDYQLIGGRSPIYEDTLWLAEQLQKKLSLPTLTFHRYLPETHAHFLQCLEEDTSEEILVFPLFPQFSYATTGSIARWLGKRLSLDKLQKLRWVKSYSAHPSFISSYVRCIEDFIKGHQLREEETVLFFSPHGLPKSFVREGDPYQKECEESFFAIKKAFPKAGYQLAYQSQFGKQEWVRPYTSELSQQAASWAQGYKNVVFVPLSFTSDHIETLFEVEYQYIPAVKKAGLQTYRCPALNRRADWLQAIEEILMDADLISNQELVRPTKKGFL